MKTLRKSSFKKERKKKKKKIKYYYLFVCLAVLGMESLSGVTNIKSNDNHLTNDNVELQNVYKYLKSTGQVREMRKLISKQY